MDIQVLRQEINYAISFVEVLEKRKFHNYFKILLQRFFYPGHNQSMVPFVLKEIKDFLSQNVHDKQNIETLLKFVNKVDFELYGHSKKTPN